VRAVLERLSAQTIPPSEVIIVDNGGTLGPHDLTGPLHERTRLIPRPDNPGYGPAVNEARALSGSALLVLTHDAVFDDGLAEDLLSALGAAPDSGASAPLLRYAADPERVFSAGGVLTAGGRALHRTADDDVAPHPVDWADGAIVMYRRAALDAIDWLSEEYFLYFEDVDTAWRMRQAGWSTLVVPAAIAYQQPGTHPMYLGVRNMTLFARHARIPLLPHLGAVTRRVAEEAAARMLRGRRPELVSAWRGWRDGRRGRGGKPAS
jgi:N-acetylglucosaminyl-diphospho-decaprenol L-rhamnosyltransferase